jgi:hypothetical protein
MEIFLDFIVILALRVGLSCFVVDYKGKYLCLLVKHLMVLSWSQRTT